MGKKCTRTKIQPSLNSVIFKTLFSNRISSMDSRVTVQCLMRWPPIWTQPPESTTNHCTHSWLTKRMHCLTRQLFMDRNWRDKSVSGRTLILSSTRQGSNFVSCNSNVPQRCVLTTVYFDYVLQIIKSVFMLFMLHHFKRDLN